MFPQRCFLTTGKGKKTKDQKTKGKSENLQAQNKNIKIFGVTTKL